MKTLQQVFSEYDRRKFFGNRYSQTADQLANGPALARRITGEHEAPVPERFRADETGQFVLFDNLAV